MNTNCEWIGNLKFVAHSGKFKFEMDAQVPFGKDEAPSPKDYVLSALCCCTGMDVIALLKRNLQPVEKFAVVAEATVRGSHPQIFTNISLKFLIEGECEATAVTEAIYLSQTLYCSISAMLNHTTSISYDVILNGKTLDKGRTEFLDNELI